MATSPPSKSGLNLWLPVTLLFLGMGVGSSLTLWAVLKFGGGETAEPKVGEASRVQTIPYEAGARGKTAEPQAGEVSRAPTLRRESELSVLEIVPQATAIATQLSDDGQFQFALQICRRSGDSILCELRVTNLTDKEILFGLSSGKTLVYTDNGLEFRALNLVLGSQADYFFYAEQTLVAKIPTPASIRFQEMPPTSKLSLLKIGYRYRSLETGQWVDDTIEFRSVPIIVN